MPDGLAQHLGTGRSWNVVEHAAARETLARGRNVVIAGRLVKELRRHWDSPSGRPLEEFAPIDAVLVVDAVRWHLT